MVMSLGTIGGLLLSTVRFPYVWSGVVVIEPLYILNLFCSFYSLIEMPGTISTS